jgi:predicted TPR repeat methyltransferase
MMSQYDSIGASYNVLEQLAYRAVEKYNVYTTIKPLLRPGVHVLDLACGTGFYSSHLLAWGAEDVLGVDISSAMLESAVSRLSSEISAGKAQFVLGDGVIPQSFAPDNSRGFFGMVFGAWFLNYASSKDQLVAMFTNISLNLTVDGVFVGVVPYPTNDIQERAKNSEQISLRQYFPRNEYVEELSSGDGWSLRVFQVMMGWIS